MNLSKILTVVLNYPTPLVHLEGNTSLDPRRDSVVYRADTPTSKVRVIIKDSLTFKMIEWAFTQGYLLSLYKDTEGSFEESDYTCSVFVPRTYDVDFVGTNFFDVTLEAIQHIIKKENL